MNDMKQKIQRIAADTLLGMALSLGNDLKLFDTIAAVSSEEEPATAAEIAAKAGLKERYVKEWLCCVACGGIVEVDESGERFWLKKENAAAITTDEAKEMVKTFKMLPTFANVLDSIENVYRKDGPLGMEYDDFKGIYDFIDLETSARCRDHFVTDFLSLIGMKDSLEKGGIEMLDVGCGTGVQSCLLAKNFPKSSFTGVDFNARALAMAENRRSEQKLDNLKFIQMDAAHLSAEWTNRFDWVMIFDSCHDQTRPDLGLREVERVLKPGGLLTIIDIAGSSNVYLDKKANETVSTMLYAISAFHCLPVGSNSEDALCLGSMWGQRRAVELFKSCGFHNVEVLPTPFFEHNILYVCRK